MTERRPERFVITFRDDYPMDMFEGMLETGFMGWGNACSGNRSRVLFLYPFPHPSCDLKVDLDELQAGGELTYVEEYR